MWGQKSLVEDNRAFPPAHKKATFVNKADILFLGWQEFLGASVSFHSPNTHMSGDLENIICSQVKYVCVLVFYPDIHLWTVLIQIFVGYLCTEEPQTNLDKTYIKYWKILVLCWFCILTHFQWFSQYFVNYTLIYVYMYCMSNVFSVNDRKRDGDQCVDLFADWEGLEKKLHEIIN